MPDMGAAVESLHLLAGYQKFLGYPNVLRMSDALRLQVPQQQGALTVSLARYAFLEPFTFVHVSAEAVPWAFVGLALVESNHFRKYRAAARLVIAGSQCA